MTYTDYNQVPLGLYVMRARHESANGQPILHLRLKTNDGPWYDAPSVPTHSQGVKGYDEFWQWAVASLPVWEYPTEIKAAL
jgi:hypothetical protein